ncbi:WXG100-like domain-containing protein [Streptomyces sp. 8N706]|uniref:WXG100-like domain-containing protein n=1 Tax=Streptomyces sp. 8N706 TaxID=3457416 RepID=UPI003FD53C84
MGVVVPGWADEVLDLIGVSWPNVDEDDYREMAVAMREFAGDIDDGAAEAHNAVQCLVSAGGGGAATEALNAHWGKVKDTHLTNLAESGRLAAAALDGVAMLIEGAKLAAIVQFGILAAEIAATVAAAPFTLGLSTLGGLAATQATRTIVRKIFQEVCQEVASQVVNIAMGPAYEALGSMAGDLVVQLGSNALGTQDGVNLGRTVQAGRESLSQGADAAKGQITFTYDPNSRMTSWTDRNGSTFRYVYDTAGRAVQTIGPDGYLSSTFTYDTEQRITRYTDSTGALTTLHLNTLGQVIAETDPLGNTVRQTWNRWDHLLTQTDPLGHTTHFEPDTSGNLVGLIGPDAVRTTAVYNDMHLPIEVTERGGLRHHYTYDDRGNLLATTDPAGARTEYEFNSLGHPTRVRDALGNTTRITTNSAGLPEQITNPSGATAAYTRDAFGRITSATDALGNTLRQGWTVEGKPTWRELPDGTREEWTWDGEGNLLTYTDRMGRTSTYTETHFDRPATSHTPDGEYHFTHDTELRLTKVTNTQGLEWHYTYNAAGHLISETDFDGRILTYERDPLGRLIRRTNAAGQTLTFERDILGRVTQLSHDDGSVSTFDHDETGHVSQITNAHATITLERNTAGRVVAETVNGRTLAFAYDALGRRTHRRTPSRGHQHSRVHPGGPVHLHGRRTHLPFRPRRTGPRNRKNPRRAAHPQPRLGLRRPLDQPVPQHSRH